MVLLPVSLMAAPNTWIKSKLFAAICQTGHHLASGSSSPHPLHSCMVWVLPHWLLSFFFFLLFFYLTQCFSALKLVNMLCRGSGPEYLEMITLFFLFMISLFPQLSPPQEGLPQPLPTTTNYYQETLSLWSSLILNIFWNCLFKNPFTYLSCLFICYVFTTTWNESWLWSESLTGS